MNNVQTPRITAANWAGCLLATLFVFAASASLAQPGVAPCGKLDGRLLPMVPSRSASETRVLAIDQVDAAGHPTGLKAFTFMTVRAPGTRSPIHVHGFGGQTCVASGEMTLFLEGSEPQRASAGTCYWMPPARRMSGVNTGRDAALMFDTFIAPNESAIWTVVEPGLQDEQKQFSDAVPVETSVQ